MPIITFKEFQKMDLRIGKVIKAEKVPNTKKLIRMAVEIGEGEIRQIVAGMAEHLRPEKLQNKNVVVLVNLEPKEFMGLESRGMILAADLDGKPILITPEEDVPPGTKIR
ncbi:MAG: methionine--tRNA ligase subunit beta [Candidatus Jordarchaeum sp.]|uniref:methionine--tRNA ligase subunit beta n=1 Tax=Candidatus Jordarchaeum sp. TaxID=2823881 RepID=UPI004049F93E